MRTHFLMIALACAGAAALLAGCGGGGGGGTPAASAPTSATLSGVAATGKAFAGATVTVYDRTGTAQGTATVDAEGKYTIVISASVPAPLVVEATLDGTTLVSTFAETKDTRLNITPLTNLIAARLSPDGDPRSLRLNASVVTSQALAAKVEEVKAILQPLLQAIGDTVDPLTGTYAASGTGHDKVLDSLDIQIRPTGTLSNIEITVRGSEEGLSRQLTSAQTTVDPLPPVSASALPPDGIATLLDDLTRRLTACFALPLSQRVNAPSDTGAVTGGPADVIAPACRTLFVGDDPATFLSNGARVGRDANNNGAFAGLFRSGATGVVFENAQLAFLRNNEFKDVVFTYRTRDVLGNIANDQLVARSVDGTLKVIGNQYVYNARVRAFMQDREFLNQPAADYVSVGYNVFISNRLDGSGNPVFSQVNVTAPNGRVLVFKPNAGRSSLAIVRADGSLTNTPVIRLAAKFKNASTSGTPAQYETGVFFTSPAYSDDELRAIPEHGVWRLEFVHVDTSKANVVQHYRTTSRAPTLAEAGSVSFVQLTDTAKAEIRTETAATGRVTFGAPSSASPNIADLSTNGGGDFWAVPTGALAPTTITVFGRGPDPDGSGPLTRPSFDDGTNVPSSARKTQIFCSRLGNEDTHCDSTDPRQYAENSIINSLELFVLSPRIVELSKMNAFYYLLPR